MTAPKAWVSEGAHTVIAMSEDETAREAYRRARAKVEELEAVHGGAWVIDLPPFAMPGDQIGCLRFQNRSSIPDQWVELAPCDERDWDGRKKSVRWNGEWTTFTESQIVREQQRGDSAYA